MTTKFVPPGTLPKQRYIILFSPSDGLAYPSPGVCRIKGKGASNKWDIRDGYMTSWATVAFNGQKLAEFDVEIAIWEPEHWLQWEVFARILTNPPPPPGVKPAAIGIGHPILNRKPFQISCVVVRDVSLWEVSDTGLWTTTISFVEFRLPRPVTPTPMQPVPAAPVLVVPQTAQQKMNAALDAQNAALRARAR